MTHKSRIYAPIESYPLPDYDCKIDVKLECGSVLIGCDYKWVPDAISGYSCIWFFGAVVSITRIKTWRLSK